MEGTTVAEAENISVAMETYIRQFLLHVENKNIFTKKCVSFQPITVLNSFLDDILECVLHHATYKLYISYTSNTQNAGFPVARFCFAVTRLQIERTVLTTGCKFMSLCWV